MRLFVSSSVVIILGLMALAGCNSQDKHTGNANTATSATNTTAARQPTNVPVTPPADNARRITVSELNEALKNGSAVVIDVRNSASYKQAHIKGATLIPFNEIGNRISELPRNKMIVTYCS